MNEKASRVIIGILLALAVIVLAGATGVIFYHQGYNRGSSEDSGRTGQLDREFNDSQRRGQDRDREASERLERARARTHRTTTDLQQLKDGNTKERGLIEALTEEVDILEGYFWGVSGDLFDPWNSADSEKVNEAD